MIVPIELFRVWEGFEDESDVEPWVFIVERSIVILIRDDFFSLNLKWLEQSGWLVKVSPSKSIQRASLTYFSSHSCYLLPSVPCSTPSPLVEERCGIVGGRGDPAGTRLDQRVHFTIKGACVLGHRVHFTTRGA